MSDLQEAVEQAAVAAVVEAQAEGAATVTEQAAEMVDTAKELAEAIARPHEDTAMLAAAIGMLQTTIDSLRAENAEMHRVLLARIDETRYHAERAEDAAEGAEDAAVAAAVEASEEPSAEAQAVTEAAVDVAEAAAEVAQPEPRKNTRRWL